MVCYLNTGKLRTWTDGLEILKRPLGSSLFGAKSHIYMMTSSNGNIFRVTGPFPIQRLIRFKIQDSNTFIHQIYMLSTLALVLNNCRMFSMSPFITIDMEILIKAWSRCHKGQHKWKRSDSPCNTWCITVFSIRFKHIWPRAVNINKAGRVIYIAFSWALMAMKIHPYQYFTIKQCRVTMKKLVYL